jgi:transposase-like protein
VRARWSGGLRIEWPHDHPVGIYFDGHAEAQLAWVAFGAEPEWSEPLNWHTKMGTVSGRGTTAGKETYSRKFQRMAVARMETCENVGELARELGVRPRCLYKWRRKLEMVEPGQEASRPSTHASAHRKEIHRLKQLLAEKTLEVDFFKGALQKIETRRQRNSGSGEMTSTTKSEKLCLAKTKSAYEINNIRRCRVTCYMDEECLVRSLGEEQPYPIAFS